MPLRLGVDEVYGPDCWRSVVVQGTFEELKGDERQYAEQRLGQARIAPLNDSAPPASETPDSVITY